MLSSKRTVLNGEGIRVMTPTEWGRLQGFIGYGFVDDVGIDGFSFPNGTARAQQYKQLGNSVTIPVIEELAWFMLDCFDKMDTIQCENLLALVKDRKIISRRDVINNLRVSKNRASSLLRIMKNRNYLIPVVTKERRLKYRLGSKKKSY